jgi:hypothetical protein
MLQQVIEGSANLDRAVRAGNTEEAAQLVAAVNRSCKDCHVIYRDR